LYCQKESIDVLRCRTCGLIYVGGIKNENDIKSHYSEKYFETYLETEDIHIKKRFKKRVREIKKIRAFGKLLDVGCGVGSFLKLARAEGYDPSGVELSRYATEYARNNFGLSVFNGNLQDAGFSSETFDIITLWHVLEHTRDPKSFLLEVNRLLKIGGLLVIEVPNIGSIAASVSPVSWELMAPKEHFFYFNPDTIELLLQATGLTTLKRQTYFWTTPSMIIRENAHFRGNSKSTTLKFLALLLHIFSPIRFKVLPNLMTGDVLTVFALKHRETHAKDR
jgi:2-polyprenyl-3-methyl-5-hydroxy-6-metoxy-1,4-benzoquinol methylase